MSPHCFKLSAPVGTVVKRLSKLMGTEPHSSNHAPLTGPLFLTAVLPIDVIKEVLLHLSGQDILRTKQVH